MPPNRIKHPIRESVGFGEEGRAVHEYLDVFDGLDSEIQEGTSLLEIGPGSTERLAQYARRNKKAEVELLDPTFQAETKRRRNRIGRTRGKAEESRESYNDTFDTIVCFWSVPMYFEDDEAVKALCANLAKWLRAPGSAFIFPIREEHKLIFEEFFSHFPNFKASWTDKPEPDLRQGQSWSLVLTKL